MFLASNIIPPLLQCDVVNCTGIISSPKRQENRLREIKVLYLQSHSLFSRRIWVKIWVFWLLILCAYFLLYHTAFLISVEVSRNNTQLLESLHKPMFPSVASSLPSDVSDIKDVVFKDNCSATLLCPKSLCSYTIPRWLALKDVTGSALAFVSKHKVPTFAQTASVWLHSC